MLRRDGRPYIVLSIDDHYRAHSMHSAGEEVESPYRGQMHQYKEPLSSQVGH
jgi:hypothetical protein